MPRINPIRRNGHVKLEPKPQETQGDKSVANPSPASKVIEVDFVPPLPPWKLRTTAIRRFTIP